MLRLIHRSVPRLVKAPFNTTVVPASMSQCPPALTVTLVPKLTTPPLSRSRPPSSTLTRPVKPELLAVTVALLVITTAADSTVPTIL